MKALLIFLASWIALSLFLWAVLHTVITCSRRRALKDLRRRRALRQQTRDWQLKADERQQMLVQHAVHSIERRSTPETRLTSFLGSVHATERAAKGMKAGYSQGRDR